jgi:SynChlorMet cassette radical SAM/SPASM protein ScmF
MTLCDLDTAEPAGASLDLPEGVPPLRAFYLYLSTSCNLACRHCWITPRFVDGKAHPGDIIDVEALRAAVVAARPLGLSRAKFTGGEPLLHPRFREIAAMLTEMGLILDMETNGTLLTADLGRFLKDETNVDFISISLDGADAVTHDAFRGVSGAFEGALSGLACLTEAGYTNTQLIMSVHRGNLTQVDAVVHLAVERGARSVKLNPVSSVGRGGDMHERGEGLDLRDHLELARYLREELRPRLKAEGTTLALILGTPLALEPLSEIMRRRGNTGACGVLGILGILGTGEIALCGIGRTIPELVYGRLGQDSIREIWFGHPTILALRQAMADVGAYPGICGECALASACRTGCVAQNYVDGQQLLWPDPLCTAAARLGLFPATRRKPALHQ